MFRCTGSRSESDSRLHGIVTPARRGRAILALLFCVTALLPADGMSQMAQGKSKFLGNALDGIFHASYPLYWNQVTPGNEGKWGSVEMSQDSYNWVPLDNIYNYAQNHSYLYKHHTLVWGAQQPGWISSLDSASQRAQVEEWIRLVGERYGSMAFIDVVNEPFHSVPPYMHALGDSGTTGWDWVVTSFTWARQYCLPGVKLILNEYNVLHDNTVTSRYLRLIDTLRVRGLIDGIAIQGHYFEFKGSGYTYSISTIKSNLSRLVATGLPVYISEFDINEANDSTQLANYKTYFPIFWEEPGVKGITLWGYVQGDMWQVNGYLRRSDGTERPALTWLKKYVALPFPPVPVAPKGTTGEPRNPLLVWRPSETALAYRVQVATGLAFTSPIVDTTITDTTLRVQPLSATTQYFWHVTAVNDSGASAYSYPAAFITGSEVVAVELPVTVPAAYGLFQNFPNPFNPATTIGFEVPAAGDVRLVVYDLLGREVAVLLQERKQAGRYSVRFDGGGRSSGVYVCRMTAGQHVQTIKMVLTK